MSQKTQGGTNSPARSMEELKELSWRMSRKIIEITTKAGSGHPSSSLSAIDVLTVLYFGGFMRYDPKRPQWEERDRFILSKGHAAPGLYVAMAEAGYFDPQLLPTLRNFGSPLEGHPVMQTMGGVEASTGSLGQGLSIGLGHALAARLDSRDYRVFVMVGDGEADQGQVWEAAMAAAKYETDNLTVILDMNGFQQTGPVHKVMPSLKPIVDKWEAFGWATFEIDGHNLEEIQEALEQARNVRGKPQAIIAHTHKGKQLSPFEEDDQIRKHGVPLTEDEEKIALRELDERYGFKNNGGK
jgi:transketolase